MSNPVVDAVHRAWADEDGGPAYYSSMTDAMTEAAEEALKPVRELHRPTGTGSECVICFDSEGRGQRWPCDTAKLVYGDDPT